MKKEAKFFCENCGEEVAQNARFCKKCGRFFSSVRCPKCGKVGSAHAFSKGCPQCGYAEKPTKTSSKNGSSGFSSQGPAKGHFYFHKPGSGSANSTSRKNYNSSSLPFWIYGITFSLLVVMIILFMRCSY